MCVRFSLQIGFLYINKHVCKQICPVGLQGQKDWIHVLPKPLLGVRAGGGLHPFCFGVRLFNPPSPLFFLLSCSSPIVFSPACPVTHLLSPRPLLSERPLRIDYWKTNQEVTGFEIKKILRSTFGDQQEKYSRKMQIFSRQFA